MNPGLPRAHGPTLRAIRHAKDLTLNDLRDLTGGDPDGVSVGYISRVERGQHDASRLITARLAEALGVTVDVLTGQVPPIATLALLRGVAHSELADAANMTAERLTRIERGTERAHPDELALIARRLGVDPAALGADAARAEPVA